MKAYGGVNVSIHIFLISAFAGGERSASRPGRFTPRERAPGTTWIGGLVDPRAGVDYVEKRKSWPYRDSNRDLHGRPARSQSLYRICYLDSRSIWMYVYIYLAYFPYFEKHCLENVLASTSHKPMGLHGLLQG
jgi:hypothetical protein